MVQNPFLIEFWGFGGVRVPGMFYILVSFVPWIIYWVLCGLGSLLGVVAPLVISLLLVLPQVGGRGFNLMALVPLLYFSLAFAGVFILDLNVFWRAAAFSAAPFNNV